MKAYSEKFKKQRKFLMVAPLLVLPFITMIFWALGGGQGTQALPDKEQQKGFNMKLPQAKLPAGNLDKMSLYHIAEQDSQALREASAQDPYVNYENTQTNLYPEDTSKSGYELYHPGYNHSYGGGTGLQSDPDPNEVKVQRKLAQLETALNAVPDTDLYSTNDLPATENGENGNAAISRLQRLLTNSQPEDSPDPELQQLNGMLEKILDIQHPGRIQEELKEQSEKQAGRVFPVTTANNTGTASLLWRPFIPDLRDDSALPLWNELQHNAFYDLTQPATKSDFFNRQAIPAVVHGTQTLVSGATVKLRLLKDIFIDGARVPRNTFVFGTCTVAGGRLDIQVKNIRYGNNIFPVSLNIFDMDGLEGIRVPGAITRDAAKEGADQTIQSLQLMDMNPSLATQAAGAGIETIKGLLGKKTKLVRVTVKAGYPVLLVDQKALQQRQ